MSAPVTVDPPKRAVRTPPALTPGQLTSSQTQLLEVAGALDAQARPRISLIGLVGVGLLAAAGYLFWRRR